MSDEFDIRAEVLSRFLRYVKINTQSDENSSSYPSTACQFDLLNLLVQELGQLGVSPVAQDSNGYVMATLPATGDVANRNIPTVGFLAHVDTSPEVSGEGVRPRVLERYDGGRIDYPASPGLFLDPEQFPALKTAVGHTLVTSDGTTLLGADDKAGVAEIMTAVAYLKAHPEVSHGPIAVGFTPDEEIGRGTQHFDLGQFGAAYAYTMDGGAAGGIQFETFSADSAEVVISGNNQHPGYAKGKMVNALKLASEFVVRLPRGRLSPETTEGREGYVHPVRLDGTVEQARISFILRDFESDNLEEFRKILERIADEIRGLEPRAGVQLVFSESYRNMRPDLQKVPFVTAFAEEAIRRIGLEPYSEPVRGGTDGARLTAMGLPTPNLFTGGYNYHSRREWVDVDEMVQAVRLIVELVRVWAENGTKVTE